MPQNLRTIANAVLARSGFAEEASIATSDPMFALANEAAMKLRKMELTRFIKTGTITFTGALTYALPTDFMTYLNDTAYQSNNVVAIIWPTPQETWARLKAGDVVPADTIYVRQLGGLLHVHNPPSSGTFSFQYLSNADITDSTGVTAKERFTVDTDLWQSDDELLTLELKWRWRFLKGFEDWPVHAEAAKIYRNELRAETGGARIIGPGTNNGPPYQPWVNQVGWVP